MTKKPSSNNSNHSFYKEAKKSFYGSEGFSKEKTWKLTKKGTKWSVYGLLTITTLWGCVNEFIIKTGDQIGTGVEFYSSSSEVAPNMFASETKMVWEATGKENDAVDNENLESWEGTELKPWDMVTLNPHFKDGEYYAENPENIEQIDDLIVPIQDAGKTNTGQMTISKYGMFNIEQLTDTLIEVDGTDSLFVSTTFPSYLKTDASDEGAEIEIAAISDWKSFYVDRLKEDSLQDPSGNILSDEITGDGTKDPTFESEDTNKYFSITSKTVKNDEGEVIEGEYESVITPRGLSGTSVTSWYAMPTEITPETKDGPKNGKWQIAADSAVPYEGMIEPVITKATDTEPEKIEVIPEENINAFATNTAISIANEIAFYSGEEASIETTIGDLLGITGDEAPKLQIQEIEKTSGIIKVQKSYGEFYKLVKDSSNVDFNKNTSISDIAIYSTWGYMNQFVDIKNNDGSTTKPIGDGQYFATTSIDDIAITTDNAGYNADYNNILTSEGNEVSNGQAYYVSTVSPKQPTIPTYDALYTMKALRPTNWDIDKKALRSNKDLNKTYVDPLAQCAGWGLLDSNGNLQVVAADDTVFDYYIIQQVYDDANSSFYNKNGDYIYDGAYGELDEDGYYNALEPLFASQRTEDWTNVGGPPDSSESDDKEVADRNFDEMMNETYTADIFTSYQEVTSMRTIYLVPNEAEATEITEIHETLYQVAYATPIAGMDSNTKVGPTTQDYKDSPDEVIRGTTTPLAWSNNSIHKTTLDSSLYNSGSRGIDEGNTARGIFAGWSDWGWAWNVKFGPLYGLFLFPISQVALFVQHVIFPFRIFGAWGVLLGVFFIVFFLRGVGSLMSLKSTSNQQKMQEVQAEVARINAKYEKYGDNKQMKQRKQQEVMALYRKKEINPLGSFGTIFITMPIFISMWILISAVPVYKIAAIGKFSFSVSALSGIFSSLFILYIMVGISVGMMQGISAKLPGWLSQKRKGVKQVTEAEKKAQKKQNKTQNIMVGVFIVIGLTVPVLLAFYWISSAVFTITLELGRHWYQVAKGKRVKVEK